MRSRLWISTLHVLVMSHLLFVCHAKSAPPFPEKATAWGNAASETEAAHLARPSPNQIAWQEQECSQFIHFGVATWEGREYDADGKTDLSAIHPVDFDADALCRAAKSWGAAQIVLVAKHVGGFCLWPTKTTDYHIGNTPYRNGEGNLVREVAEACRRHGLNMGVYLYPDDTRFAKGIGRRGRTDDPADQETWNRLFIRQWEEVLDICGPDLVNEAWLDGGCVIDVLPTVKRLAPRAVVFNKGDYERVRWPGNEDGVVPDVNWSAIDRKALLRGAAHLASDPDGDTWAPFECDTPLYDHNWFWTPRNESKRKSVDHLMATYVKSVGNGAALLLNATPNTLGVLPQGDLARLAAFGEAIERNFGTPLAEASTPAFGTEAELTLDTPAEVNCVEIWEDYRLGHRIRAFVVEGWIGKQWVRLGEGQSVGRRKMVFFPGVRTDRIRVRVTRSVGTPVFRALRAFRVEDPLVERGTPPPSRMAVATASSEHGPVCAAAHLIDGMPRTRWSAKDQDPDPWVELDFGRRRKIGRASLSELADRVRMFRIEVRNDPEESWRTVHEGGTIGKQLDISFARVTTRYARLHILQYEGPAPTLWTWELHDRPEAYEQVGVWRGGETGNWDLTGAIDVPGTYELRFEDAGGAAHNITDAILFFEESEAPPADFNPDADTIRITRSQAIGPGASIRVRGRVDAPAGADGRVIIRPAQ